ncbi:hypothetical protein L596_013760 [Steinernema carpocapsae]|uniref:Uncharacterized protein n=1 Tax=Steinernema carpocapsae TaxID=34508 RepID=A0A4U5P155_STECR|nr:hypothetical protein L596_013760 [Steinernema carpocapsae]
MFARLVLVVLCLLALFSANHGFPLTDSAKAATDGVYCAPFCNTDDYDGNVFPDYADVEPEIGSNIGMDYH